MMFTIIFPVLNERLRLESGVTRTVEYLQSIAFEDYEIIIVDNGSEDETPQIAEKLCKKYDKVKYERINVRGVGAAFRRGVEVSHGDVVGYMDSTFPPISGIWERLFISSRRSRRSSILTAAVLPENPIPRAENGTAGSRRRDC